MSDYLRRMQALIDNHDYEDAHSQADALLTEALLSLRTQASPELAEQITQLTEAYEAVGKWYT